MPVWESTEQYIKAQTPEAQEALCSMRKILRDALPGTEECISYSMPALRIFLKPGPRGGRGKSVVLVYYAAAKHHLGFYPTAGPIEAFREELASYAASRGAVRFPLDQPLPADLITRMAQYRMREAEGGHEI
ncbi:MAG: iron chaperone [Lachnospiraceae bacterium]